MTEFDFRIRVQCSRQFTSIVSSPLQPDRSRAVTRRTRGPNASQRYDVCGSSGFENDPESELHEYTSDAELPSASPANANTSAAVPRGMSAGSTKEPRNSGQTRNSGTTATDAAAAAGSGICALSLTPHAIDTIEHGTTNNARKRATLESIPPFANQGNCNTYTSSNDAANDCAVIGFDTTKRTTMDRAAEGSLEV